jgi:hypothetical protein
VDVAQGDVLGGGRQGLRDRGPVLAQVDEPLRVGQHRAVEVRVRHEQVDAVGAEGAGQVGDRALELLRIAGLDHGLVAGQLQGRGEHARRGKGQGGDQRRLPAVRRHPHDSPLRRRPRPAEHADAGQFGQLPEGLHPACVVVVPRDHHRRDLPGPQPAEKLEDELFRVGAGVRRVEDVAGHEQQVHPLALQVAGQVVQYPRRLVEPAEVLPDPPDVPVGRMYHAH